AMIAARSSGVGSGRMSTSMRLSLKETRAEDDGSSVGRLVVLAVAAACALSVPMSGLASPRAGSWDQKQIDLVTARGLLGGDAATSRPAAPLPAGELGDLVAGLTGKTAVPAADPLAPVTIAQLDAALIRGEGLQPAAARFRAAAVAAGLKPPARFGPE